MAAKHVTEADLPDCIEGTRPVLRIRIPKWGTQPMQASPVAIELRCAAAQTARWAAWKAKKVLRPLQAACLPVFGRWNYSHLG
jgi:hypothetical protein